MRRILPFLLRLARAIIVPRYAAVTAELRASRTILDMGRQLAGHQAERIAWAGDIRAAEDQANHWRIEAAEHKREADGASLALKLCREELAACHVQIDQSAKIINKHNQQELREATIARIRAGGQVNNDDVVRAILDQSPGDD